MKFKRETCVTENYNQLLELIYFLFFYNSLKLTWVVKIKKTLSLSTLAISSFLTWSIEIMAMYFPHEHTNSSEDIVNKALSVLLFLRQN